MPTTIRRLDGYLPGKGPGADDRDYNIRQLLAKAAVVRPLPAALPAVYQTVDNPIVLDQGSTPECVAFASSGMKTDDEFREWDKVYKFNSGVLYNLIAEPGGGAYPRNACAVMLHQGMQLAGCRGKMDLKWGIDSYYGVTAANTDDEIKAALYQYGTMIFASSWYDNWMNKFSVFPLPVGSPNGGHCYRCIGWNTIGWIIVNSWGTILWGVWGVATMPYDIYRSYVLPEGDSWKIIDKI